MAMIWPAPAPEVGVRPDRLYTDWMAAGDRPVGVGFVICGLPSGSVPTTLIRRGSVATPLR